MVKNAPKGHIKFITSNRNHIENGIIEIEKGIADISYFFHNSEITSIDLTELETEHLRNINGLFYNCKKLKEVDLSEKILKNIVDLPFLFAECDELEKVNLNNTDFSSASTLKGTFFQCNKLKTIELNNTKLNRKLILDRTFYSCDLLTTINLNEVDFGASDELELSLEKTFGNCSELMYVRLPDKPINVKDFIEVFSVCRNINYINLKEMKFSNKTKVDHPFIGTISLKELDMSKCSSSDNIDGKSFFYGLGEGAEVKVTKNFKEKFKFM